MSIYEVFYFILEYHIILFHYFSRSRVIIINQPKIIRTNPIGLQITLIFVIIVFYKYIIGPFIIKCICCDVVILIFVLCIITIFLNIYILITYEVNKIADTSALDYAHNIYLRISVKSSVSTAYIANC